MKVYLVHEGKRHRATVPYSGAEVVHGAVACPSCGSPAPIAVSGTGIDRYGHNYEDAPAVARCCGTRVGRLRVEYSTIFGIEEDRRVLAGPWRVY